MKSTVLTFFICSALQTCLYMYASCTPSTITQGNVVSVFNYEYTPSYIDHHKVAKGSTPYCIYSQTPVWCISVELGVFYLNISDITVDLCNILF